MLLLYNLPQIPEETLIFLWLSKTIIFQWQYPSCAYSLFGGKIIRYKIEHMMFSTCPTYSYVCKLWQASSNMKELNSMSLLFLPILMSWVFEFFHLLVACVITKWLMFREGQGFSRLNKYYFDVLHLPDRIISFY